MEWQTAFPTRMPNTQTQTTNTQTADNRDIDNRQSGTDNKHRDTETQGYGHMGIGTKEESKADKLWKRRRGWCGVTAGPAGCMDKKQSMVGREACSGQRSKRTNSEESALKVQ